MSLLEAREVPVIGESPLEAAAVAEGLSARVQAQIKRIRERHALDLAPILAAQDEELAPLVAKLGELQQQYRSALDLAVAQGRFVEENEYARYTLQTKESVSREIDIPRFRELYPAAFDALAQVPKGKAEAMVGKVALRGVMNETVARSYSVKTESKAPPVCGPREL